MTEPTEAALKFAHQHMQDWTFVEDDPQSTIREVALMLDGFMSSKIPCPHCSGKKIFAPLDMQPIIDRFCKLPFVIHAHGTWSMDEHYKVLVTALIQIDTEHWGNRCRVYGLEMEIMQQNPDVEFDFSCTAVDTPNGVTGGPSG